MRRIVETGEGFIGIPQDLVLDKEGKLSGDGLRTLNETLKSIITAINGNLSFGIRTKGARAGNFLGQYVEVTTPGANTEFQVDHDLGRVPIGVIPLWQNKAGSFYTERRDGWGETRVFLKCSVATLEVGLLLI